MVEGYSEYEPGWHWRNCREASVGFFILLWPWHFDWSRDDDYTGGSSWLVFGPLGIRLYYGLGGLGEIEAYDRACRFEGFDPDTGRPLEDG